MLPLTRRTLLLGLTLALGLPLGPAVAARQSGPPLWLARRGAAKVYFFGQMPLRTDSRWQSESVLRAFDASAEFWTENPDPSSGPPPEPPKASGPRLIDSISEAEMERLRRLLVREGLKADALDTASLADGYSAVSYLQDHALGADFQVIPERVLRERARTAGKSVHSEWSSIKDVQQFRASLSSDTQRSLDLELLRRGMEEAEDTAAADQRLAAWLRGDLRPLNALEQSQRRRYPVIARLIGRNRNEAWASRTADIMNRTSISFVCVGIGHLLGPESIQTFLRSSGCTVQRVG